MEIVSVFILVLLLSLATWNFHLKRLEDRERRQNEEALKWMRNMPSHRRGGWQ
jgi:hypothetical protein